MKTDSEGREYRVREWDGKLVPVAKVTMDDIHIASQITKQDVINHAKELDS
jgi:hypothetical protein